jgi:hypothetical protein
MLFQQTRFHREVSQSGFGRKRVRRQNQSKLQKRL